MNRKKNKRHIRALFDGLDRLSSEDIVESDILKDLLKNSLPDSIENALEEKKQFATIFEINASGSYIELQKHQWIQALETIIMWLVDSEDYEKCNKIKELISKIKDSASGKKVVRTKTN